METGAWTKSEYFAWNDGRRIVDLQELAEQLHCKQCGSVLDLQRTEREARYGFASVLYIHCNCGLMNDVYTCRLQQNGEKSVDSASTPVFEINNEASINVLMYGGSSSSVILKFLALLDIPVPPRSEAFCHGRNNTTDTSVGAELAPLPPSSSAAGTDWGWTMSASGDRGATSRKSLPVPVAISESDCVERPAPEAYSSANDDNNGVAVQITNNNMYIVGDVYHVEEDGLDSSGSVGDGLDDKDDEYVPPDELKQRLKAQIKSKKRKPVARRPRNTAAKSPAKKAPPAKSPAKKASPRKPVKKLKVKVKEESKEDTMEGQENEKGEKAKEKKQKDDEEKEREGEGSDDNDNDKDMDWSSTESEEDKPVVEKGKSKRGGGPRPKGGKLKQGQGGECTECGKTFVSVKGYNVHMKRVHNQDMKGAGRGNKRASGNSQSHSQGGKFETPTEPVPVPTEIYVCMYCQQPFARDYTVLNHIQHTHWTLDMKPQESYVTMQVGSIIHLMPRKTKVHRTFRCLLCGFTKPTKPMAEHIVISPDGMLACAATCPKGKKLLYSEMNYMFTDKQGYLCDTCGEVFKVPVHLDTHLLKVHGVMTERHKRCQCRHCGATYSLPSILKRHIAEKHSHSSSNNSSSTTTTPSVPALVCDVCGKEYQRHDSLAVHRRRHHTEGKRFQCQYCPKRFFKRGQWLTHTRKHFNLSQHVCSWCEDQFSSGYALKVHQRRHTGEKPYQCRHCPARFAQKTSLTVHLRKHEKMEAGTTGAQSQHTPPPQPPPLPPPPHHHPPHAPAAAPPSASVTGHDSSLAL